MNRFVRTGEIAEPCGVPLVRVSRVPPECCNGAASHRLTYSSTERQSVTASTARTTRSHGTSSKNFWRSGRLSGSLERQLGVDAAAAEVDEGDQWVGPVEAEGAV